MKFNSKLTDVDLFLRPSLYCEFSIRYSNFISSVCEIDKMHTLILANWILGIEPAEQTVAMKYTRNINIYRVHASQWMYESCLVDCLRRFSSIVTRFHVSH